MASSSRSDMHMLIEDHIKALPYDAQQMTLASLAAQAKEKEFANLQSFLLMYLDHKDGILSSIVVSNDYPTGIALVRDARKALPLEKRLAPDSLTHIAINTSLRMLTTMRAILYALETNGNQDAMTALTTSFYAYFVKILDIVRKNIPQTEDLIAAEEENFNCELAKTLYASGIGICASAEYPELLLHYRALAATLERAKSLETILLQEVTNSDGGVEIITHREIAHPITVKTEEQKIQLDIIKESHHDHTIKNSHTILGAAFQKASVIFKKFICDDNRRLPSQSMIAPSLKNAYVVYNELTFPHEIHGNNKGHFWSLRCGSMVYTGPGETYEARECYTRENLLQLSQAANKLVKRNMGIHITMLLTQSAIANTDDQNLIIRITEEQRRQLSLNWSHVQTNWLGLTSFLNISGIIARGPSRSFLDSRATRMKKAGEIIKLTNTENENILSVATCKEGMDRTGTASEFAAQERSAFECEKFRIRTSREEIEKARALGCHNAVIASFAMPGSTGMKLASCPENLFLAKTNEFLYRKTAYTHKSVVLNEKYLAELLQECDKENQPSYPLFSNRFR